MLFATVLHQLTFAQETRVKNVILLIGDGMGLNQVYSAMVSQGTPLNIEKLTTIGLSKTYSNNNFTADSGAGGTAIACGIKTNNGMIGMSPDSIPYPSIMEIAKKNGFSTGLVVACNVTHATPACFVAHEPNRNDSDAIAADFLKSGIDIFVGGGKTIFEQRKDNRNLSQELKNKGYAIAHSMHELETTKAEKIAALLYSNHPPQAAQRDSMLYRGTKCALTLLSKNKNGFFLMVEGSQIDWGCHLNDKNYLNNEVLDFDQVVGLAINFAQTHENTLIVVTADHETGGLTLVQGNISNKTTEEAFATKNHTGMPVPIYSYGYGCNNFKGFMENTDIFRKIKSVYGLK